MSSRLLLIIVIIIAGLGLYLGFGSKYFQNTQPQKYTGPVEKITIGAPVVVPELRSLFFIAEEQGYFAKQGLEVLIEPKNTSVEINQELRAGTLDLGLVTDFTFVRDSFDPSDLRILAGLGKLNNLSVIGRIDKSIRQPSDLKGKKVAVIPRTATEFFLDRSLILNGLSRQDVEIVPINQAGQVLPALIEEKVDAIVFTNKAVVELEKALKEKVVSWSIQNDTPHYLMLVADQKRLLAHKEAFKRLMAALIEASDYLETNQTSARELIDKHLSAQDTAYLVSHWQDFNFGISLNQDLILLMEDQARWVIANKLTDKTKVPNYLDFIYFDALEQIKPETVTIIH